ncbi:Eukaryotic aspartyl protease family protein [Euphorbia peplus]|nr:Eukaryotic aspartyl protease family protein [Euphorbia peplus]
MAAAGIFVLALLCTAATSHCASFPTTFSLERGISPSHDLSELREIDSYRHRRSLLSNGDIYFPLQGTYQPPSIGVYYTKLRLGTPAKDYYVQIDTGSDVVLVSCTSCQNCPTKSDLNVPIHQYDPGTSSSSGIVPCWHPVCDAGIETSDAFCSTKLSICGFALNYTGGNAYGYYVSDDLHMFEASDSSMSTSFKTPLVFGCTAMLTGTGTKINKAVGGVLGLGPRNMSFISQLASQGKTPRIFSHCLRGDATGGGMLVLGEITAPRVVYTPLVQSQSQYKVDLQSISIGGKTLAIDRSVFKTTETQGTVIDSGTTLAYLADGVYDPVIETISEFALRNAISYPNSMYKCFLVGARIENLFPKVTLNFAGGASMVLHPRDYLVQQQAVAGDVRCIGFESIPGQKITVLGDLVLRDKIVVYDMEKQRFGWTSYNCSVADAVSSSTNNGMNQKLPKSNSSPRDVPLKMISMAIIALLLQMFMGSSYLFL